MSARKIRRAVERQARKAARKAGFSVSQSLAAAAPIEAETHAPENNPIETSAGTPEPGSPFPSLSSMSPDPFNTNRTNALNSTGPKSAATRAISAQNQTIHGLARHQNGNFKLLTSEDAAAFEALQQSLISEHHPETATESILVNAMAESHWLAARARRLQDACLDPHTGAVTNEKQFSLYLRYQTTHTRAFHKSLNDLLKLRSEKRKAELGFEAQRIAKEKHAMKKQAHYWTVLKKDGEACHRISLNTIQNLKASAEFPDFDAHYAAELAKHGLTTNSMGVAAEAA